MKKILRIICSVPKKLKKLRIRERLKTLAKSDADKGTFREDGIFYEIELIDQRVNFMEGTLKKTYQIVKKFAKSGIMRKVTLGIVTVLSGLSLRFGSGNYTPTQEQPIRQTPVQVERQLKHPSLTEPIIEGSQSPSYSVQNLVKISGGAKQNKAGINDLPDSSRFIYRLETKSAKKTVKKVWKNSKARKELLAGLKRMDKGELLPRNEKSLKGFKKLKEVKLNDVRVIVNPKRKGDPDEIVGIVMRKDLKAFTKGFDKKFQ